MDNFFNKLEPIDVIALVVIAGGLALKFTGADGLVGTLMTAAVFYYFGKAQRTQKQTDVQIQGKPEQMDGPKGT